MRKKQEFNRSECFAEALKYSSRAMFFKGSQWAYSHLQKRGLLGDACSHMQMSPIYAPPKWTHESAFAEAAKFGSRSEFKKNCSGAHGYLIVNNALDQACAHMRGSGFWHIFELMAIAIKYSNFHEFKKCESQAYNFANKNKLTLIAGAHMAKSRISWTKESVMAEAQKHQSVSDFLSAFPGAYKHANKYGYWADVCSHMDVKKRPVNKDMVLHESKKYQSRAEFQKQDGGAYSFARTRGFLDEACAHMDVLKRNLDREFVLTEAKKFNCRSNFKLMEIGCYMYAKRNGFLDAACAHMKLLPSGFKDAGSATMYHLRISGQDGSVLYKIGITNRTPRDRIQSLYLNEGFSAEVLDEINFDSGREARIAEKRLHRRASNYRYAGPPIMKNGNTELFTENMFGGDPVLFNGNTELFSRDATTYLSQQL